MVSTNRAWMVLFVFVGLTLSGCNETDSVVPGGGGKVPVPTPSLLAAAEQVRRAPVAIETADMILRIWGPGHSCTESFDLGNGLSVTCEVEPTVGARGLRAVGSTGGPIEIDWSFSMTRVLDDGRSLITLENWGESSTTWAGGAAYPSFGGTVYTDGNGNATGFDFALTDHGLGANMEYWRVTPSELHMLSSNKLFSIRIDRQAGTGTVSIKNEATSPVNVVAASLTIQGGCTSVDFVDPALEDQNGCLW